MKKGCQTCKYNRKRTVREKTCLKGHRAVFGYGCKDYIFIPYEHVDRKLYSKRTYSILSKGGKENEKCTKVFQLWSSYRVSTEHIMPRMLGGCIG